MLPRIAMRSALSACKKRPYWSCMIRPVALSVRLSMPMVFSMMACVSRYFSALRFCQLSSTYSERFSVALPLFVRVRVTRYSLSPR